MKSFLLPLLAMLLGGCASLPDNSDREESHALSGPRDSLISRDYYQAPESEEGKSAFLLLGNGLDAFVARAVLAQQATTGIDLQYYMIHGDHVGELLVGQLLKAADRGVRVRILLDDIDEGRRDFDIAVFDMHPNIEVRIFNPFGRNVARGWQYVTGFGRQTRRAHNKSFTVDNIATILGGRNIGDEYFERDPELAFQDLDVLAVGPVAERVSKSFDDYWNFELSYPIASLLDEPPTQADYERLRKVFEQELERLESSPYIERLQDSDLARGLRAGSVKYEWAVGHVYADPPEKLLKSTGDDQQERMIDGLLPYLEGAKEELIIASPYFVPGKDGVAFLRKLRERGVRVRILTNSLASTDVAIVHAGYARYRKALLRAGVELWELDETISKEDRKAIKEGHLGESKSSLHAKAFVVDRKTVFIGSLNLDPRSVIQNTEIGVVFESPAIGRHIAEDFDADIDKDAFRLELVEDKEDGRSWIVWHGYRNGRPVTWDTEPNTGFWRRFGVGFLRLMPIESQI